MLGELKEHEDVSIQIFRSSVPAAPFLVLTAHIKFSCLWTRHPFCVQQFLVNTN